jgi:hypothetical protein
MRAQEFINEQGTVGTIGTTTGKPQTVSQTSSPTQQTPTTQQPDPKIQKLAATLKQNKVIGTDIEINDFLGAYQAQSTGKTLNPDQQASMAKLASALIKDRNLGPNLDLQLKTMSQQKPGQPAAPQNTTTPTGVK